MSQPAEIHVTIEPQLKNEVEEIFSDIGLNPSDAIALFYHQVAECNGLPFQRKVPNKETLATFEEAKKPENLLSYASVEIAMRDMWDND